MIPACSVVEFGRRTRLLRGRSRIAEGAEVGTAADGTVCTFRTTRAVDLLPLTLGDTILVQSSPGVSVLARAAPGGGAGAGEIFQEEGVSLFSAPSPWPRC